MSRGEATTVEPRLTVILGQCSDMRAEVYLRLTGLTDHAAVSISGKLAGPRSRFAITLPTTAVFTGLGPAPDGASALARAILTEPSYWTPDLPSRYHLQAVATTARGTLVACDQLIGLRRLGIRGRSFWLDGRRWVPRGVFCDPAHFDPAPLRESLAVAVVDDPAESLCDTADDWGVGVVAWCRKDPLAACRRWLAHPSVMLAVLPRSIAGEQLSPLATAVRQEKGSLLLGLEVDATEPPPPVPEGLGFFVVAMAAGGLPHPAWREAPPDVPLVAMRPVGGRTGEKRRGCDLLQADLAAWRAAAPAAWDWAGYLV